MSYEEKIKKPAHGGYPGVPVDLTPTPTPDTRAELPKKTLTEIWGKTEPASDADLRRWFSPHDEKEDDVEVTVLVGTLRRIMLRISNDAKIYISAVKGRSAFRLAIKSARTRADAAEARCKELEQRLNHVSMCCKGMCMENSFCVHVATENEIKKWSEA
jgi:hypothetical protein